MPKVFDLGPYTIYFCHNKGNIGLKRLRDIQAIVESQHRLIIEKWTAKFGRVTYYC